MSDCFNELKTKMIRGPVLELFDMSKLFEVETDTSDIALDTVLTKEDHPIA